MRTLASGWIILGALLLTSIPATPAEAQFMYPMGYRGYGWNQWGADPAAGYMAGLGSFAKGKGEFLVDKAKADQIKSTMEYARRGPYWNKTPLSECSEDVLWEAFNWYRDAIDDAAGWASAHEAAKGLQGVCLEFQRRGIQVENPRPIRRG